MKKEFSNKWKGSRQARKQRKYLAKAPIHVKQKLLSAHLDKELRKKYGKRSLQLRKDDAVKIMSGEFRGKSGKVSVINLKKMKVAVEGLQITKKDGSKANVYFEASNVMITSPNLDDKKRMNSLKREAKGGEEKK